MKAVLVNYNFTPTWLLTSGLDYILYDRSDSKEWLKDFDQSRIIYTKNIGQVDYDKLSYLVENYDTLPGVFLWGKSNLFKYISEGEFDKVKDNEVFTPLLTKSHKTYGDICYYKDGMYFEKNNGWYTTQFESKYAKTYEEFSKQFNLPNPDYLPFAPGGNYILTKEVVHKYPRDFYANMANMMPHCREPLEAQFAERSYFNTWHG